MRRCLPSLLLLTSLALPAGLALSSAPPARGDVAPIRARMCQRTLAVGRVDTRAGCQIDERVSGHQAVLTYPCGGGPATASFGASRFEGTVNGRGEVLLQIQTRFPFSDGCTWETKQRISGNLNSRRLAYEYREQPVRGQTGCARGCVGTATVTVR